MDLMTALVTYQLIWWVVLFMVLPWGVKPQGDSARNGSARGAPRYPRLLQKILSTTLISALLFLAFQWAMTHRLIRLRPTEAEIQAREGYHA